MITQEYTTTTYGPHESRRFQNWDALITSAGCSIGHLEARLCLFLVFTFFLPMLGLAQSEYVCRARAVAGVETQVALQRDFAVARVSLANSEAKASARHKDLHVSCSAGTILPVYPHAPNESALASASFNDLVYMASEAGETGPGVLTMKWSVDGSGFVLGDGWMVYRAGYSVGLNSISRSRGIFGDHQGFGYDGPLELDQSFSEAIYVSIPFTWGQAFSIDGNVTAFVSAEFWGTIQPMAFLYVSSDLGNSVKYEGIVEVRNSQGQIVTNYTIHSASGTDWTQPYVPDPSPVLTQAIATNGTLRVLGSFQARSNETYTLAFEVPRSCSISQPFLDIPFGERTVLTDGAGHVDFDFLFSTNLTLPAFVRATATDDATNTSPRSVCLPITDAQPPAIICPAAMFNPSPDSNGVVVAYHLSVTDNNPNNLTVVYTPPTRSVLPVGLTTVNCTATDASGNISSCSFDVTVAVQPVVEWVGGSGDWNTPTNWNTGVVPGPGDNVVINRPGDLTITHSSGDDGVLSLVCKENLMLSGGSLSVSNVARFEGNLSISGGELSGNADMMVTGTLDLTSGTLSGSGDVTVTGTLNWILGTMSGSGKTLIAASGVLNINAPASYLFLHRVLQNDGTVNWLTGYLWMRSGTFNNNGTFNATGALTANTDQGVNVINNASTFTKSGAGTVLIYGGIAFNNTGTLNVQEGTLTLYAGTNTGTIQLAAGASLNLNDTYTHAATSILSGDGTLNLNGGTQTFPAGAQVSTVTLNLAGATVNFATPKTFALVNLSAGELGGAGDVTVTGTLNWTGASGTMGGSGKTIIAASGALNMNAPGQYLFLHRVLQNDGSATWTSGLLWMRSGTFNNNGTFNATGALTVNTDQGVNAINNAGTFTKSGSGTALIYGGIAFNNTGTLNVQEGALTLVGGGANTGTIQLAAGASLSLNDTYTHAATSILSGAGTLNLNSGTQTFPAGAQVSAGTLNLAGATINFATPKTFALVNLTAGELSGSGDVTVTGTLNWTGGIMSGGGKTIIPATGVLALNSPGYLFLRRLLQNDGSATWTSGQLWIQSGTINNNGTFNATGALTVNTDQGVNAINNAGTFTKSGSGTALIYGGIAFNNTGTLEVQAGTFTLVGGGTNTGTVHIIQGVLQVLVGGIDFPGSAALRSEIGGTLELSDGGLTGTSTNTNQYAPKGRVLIDGGGSRQLEVMSRDLGNLSAGYETNFAYGTLELGGSVNLTLVDNADNSPGPEALYLDKLIVPVGTTVNLSGLNVYVRSKQIAGNVTGGTITLTPPELSFTLGGGGGGLFTLSWPAGYAGFILEFSESLTSPIDWQPVTSGVSESGGIKSYTVTNDPNVSGRLYRLRLP